MTGLTADNITEELLNELYQVFRQIVIEADPLTDIPDAVIESFRIYKKSNLAHIFSDYLIVQLIVNTENYTGDFLSYMYTKIQDTILFSFNEISFSSEFVWYELVYHQEAYDDWQFELKIGTSEENILDQIPFEITSFNAKSEWLRFQAFKKLSICPFITLESQGFSVQIDNDGFLILGNSVTTARFSPWEFELDHLEWTDIIHLCASDYEARLISPQNLNNKQTTAENNNSAEPIKIQFGWLVGLSTGCLLIT